MAHALSQDHFLNAFAHHLGAHVLELVLKLDFLGDGDAVLGDAGCAERLVEHDVAALGAPRFTISLKRSTQKSSAIHKLGRPITPSFGARAENICSH
jgi:hypothetical protein